MTSSHESQTRGALTATDLQHVGQHPWTSLPLALTLNTGKVYIGLIAEAFDPIRKPTAVLVLPILSGNRDADGRLNLTTDYAAVYSNLSRGRAAQLGLSADWESEFKLVVRADEIVTAATFSPDIYTEFNPGWRCRIAQQTRKKPAGGDEPASDDRPPAYVLSSIGRNF